MTVLEEWTETTCYKSQRKAQVLRAPIVPGWQLITQHFSYHLYEPGFLGPKWVATWMRRTNKSPHLDGHVDAEFVEQAVKRWPYEVAVAFLEAVKTQPPAPTEEHNASAYDHRGCRCDICKADKAAKNKAYRERKALKS